MGKEEENTSKNTFNLCNSLELKQILEGVMIGEGVGSQNSKNDESENFKILPKVKLNYIDGHIEQMIFDTKYWKWNGSEPIDLIEKAKIFGEIIPEKKKKIEEILGQLEPKSQLIYWHNGKPESHAIIYELHDLFNVQNDLEIEIFHTEIHNLSERAVLDGLQNLKKPDINLAKVIFKALFHSI